MMKIKIFFINNEMNIVYSKYELLNIEYE